MRLDMDKSRIKWSLRGMLALIIALTVVVPTSVWAASGDVISIEISGSSPQKMNVGETTSYQVLATVEGADHKQDVTGGVTWSTSNTAVVTITKGKAKAIAAGEATIVAQVSGVKAQVVVQVQDKIKSIKASPNAYTFVKGNEGTLPKVSITRANGKEEEVTSDIVWTVSSNLAVIENGKIKGVTPGKVILQGKYGSTLVKVPITVTDTISKIEVKPATIQLTIKKSTPLKVMGTYSSGKTVNLSKSVVWTSSNPGVAAVKNGTVKGMNEGQATLTGTYQGQTVTVQVNVVPTLQKLIMGQKSLVLSPQSSSALGVMAQYDTGKTLMVTGSAVWSSSKPNVATVANGRIVALAKGKTSITAKWGNKKVTIPVTVK
ncbi:Ig-like domain (group 2) [Paenibacillus polysaccharolyticus]|uniref:Ig-like domain (Group 2) n=1 Tax=Paenibacillus polysaccharolyticus TaxID=582692 RepID=A0A1G5H2A9_9BACL|nr:Ig-like domain-containing protein [Paenibacillus polysaccharolyticus]SCY57500.1 Ig-like domain (group 2) [Paenibacillus polysaccharolyticus]